MNCKTKIIYILGAQGTGIYLIQKPEQIRKPEACQLIQEYIIDPYLMNDNLKFDFRVYAIIKSINPLSIYVAREGFNLKCLPFTEYKLNFKKKCNVSIKILQ